jgi:DNA invertase Pin-like site-specific DNA recombinase
MNYAYLRVSTSKQDLDSQKSLIEEYSKQNNILIDKFIEVEISSKKSLESRKIDTLKSTLKKNDTLVVIELSRLGRNILEILSLVKELKQKGIKLIFIRQPELNTSSNNAINDLILSIYSYVAQTERELISQRTKEALKVKKDNGVVLGRTTGTFTGSVLDSKKELIMERLNNKVSISKIALELNTTKQNLSKYIERHNLKHQSIK